MSVEKKPVDGLQELKNKIESVPIVVITGPMGSGKGTAAEILQKEFDFQHITVSDILRQELILRGQKPPFFRSQCSDLAEELSLKFGGKQLLAQKAIERISSLIDNSSPKGIIVEGNRYLEESKYFSQFSNVATIWLDAPINLRFRRISERKRPGDVITLEEFTQRDFLESEWMCGIKNLSNVTIIENDNTPEELSNKLITFVSQKFWPNRQNLE